MNVFSLSLEFIITPDEHKNDEVKALTVPRAIRAVEAIFSVPRFRDA